MKHLAGNIWRTKKDNLTIGKHRDIIIPVSSMSIEQGLVKIEHEKMEQIRIDTRRKLGLE